MARLVALLLVLTGLALWLLGPWGRLPDGEPLPGPSSGPRTGNPSSSGSTSGAAAEHSLEAARDAEGRGDDAAVATALAAAETGPGDAGRIATTWQLTRALQAGDAEGALVRLRRIVDHHGGRGLDPRGHDFASGTLAGALAEEAAAAARRAVEGSAPDPTRAARLLAAGREAIEVGDPDDPAEALAPLEAAQRYVALSATPFRPSDLLPAVPARTGPRVLVLCDHFGLGEDILPSVLRRWARRLPVGVVGLRTGAVRVGIRRVPVAPEEEARALGARIAELGLREEGLVEAEAARTALGLGEGAAAAVFLLGADDRIVARLSGRVLDPRVLDPALDRLRGPAKAASAEGDAPPK